MIWLCACLVDGGLYRDRRAALTDDDRDRWTEDAGDCNDADADVHPGAAEVCNHVDDDCDGAVDEVLPTWFLDGDDDGYGNAETSVTTCDTPASFVSNGTDCDDDHADAHPNAPEICDGIDDDCDQRVDADDDDLVGVSLYTDGDDDGFGDDATERVGCVGEDDGVTVGGDCDDFAPEVNPGATDICEDGVDTNCDGSSLGCTGTAADADAAFFGESAGDEAGLDTASGVDLDGNGYADLIIGARSDDDAGTDAGAAYVILGPVSPGEHSLSTASVKLTGPMAGDKAGRAVAFAGDIDADGIEDIAVSATLHDERASDAGSVYFVAANDLVASTGGLEAAAWGRIDGTHNSDYCGTAMVRAGDVNADGIDDLWIGASGVDPTAADSDEMDFGAVFLLLGPLERGENSVDDAEAELIGGSDTGRNIGTVVASGDYNGDGFADVAVGDRYDEAQGYLSGAVFVVAGPAAGSLVLSESDAKVLSDTTLDALGSSASANGDLNDDGYDDFLVGAPDAEMSGLAFLIAGSVSIEDLSGEASTTAYATIASADSDIQGVGSSVGSGDFDGDGTVDVIVGASGSGPLGQGAAFLVTALDAGRTTLGASAIDALRINGVIANDEFGAEAAFTGSVHAGSAAGVLVSSGAADTSGGDAGGVYLIWDVGL